MFRILWPKKYLRMMKRVLDKGTMISHFPHIKKQHVVTTDHKITCCQHTAATKRFCIYLALNIFKEAYREQLNMEEEQHYREYLVSILNSSFSIFFPLRPFDRYILQEMCHYFKSQFLVSAVFISEESVLNFGL